MSRIAPTGVSAVRPRVTAELGGKPGVDDRGRSRDSAPRSRGPEVPNIRQLRSRFQPDDAPRTAPASLGGAATSDVPEIRLQAPAAAEGPSSRTRADPESPMHVDDPERYFESTNHTQRFRQTRALFVDLEEQTRLERERERRQQMFHRSKSPTRFPATSAASLAIPPAIAAASGDASPTSSSTDSGGQRSPDAKFSRYGAREPPRWERPRVSSASTDVGRDAVVGFRQELAKPSTFPTPAVRSSSVDRLDDDAAYEPSSLRQSAKFSSRSETDVGGSVREDVPSPKWLMQHYEDIVRKNAALFGGQVTRRRARPAENHVHSGGPDGLREEEAGMMQPAAALADRKVTSSGSQSQVENIPPGSSDLHQDRVGAPKVRPASGNAISRYGRSEYQPPSQKQAQSANAVASKKPVASTAEGKDHGEAVKPGSRYSTKDEDDTVLRSFEDWKARRRVSSKYDEPETENAQHTSDEKPFSVADRYPNSADTVEIQRGSLKENAEMESTKPTASEPSLIFGVALRSTASKTQGQEAKLQPELGADLARMRDIETAFWLDPVSAARLVEVSPIGTVASNNGETLTGLPTNGADGDFDMDEIATDESGRRRSIELAEVPHFPKDSVMLSSPRASEDESHHPAPPSFHESEAEDSVFVKEHTPTETSDLQLDNHSLPERENGDVDIPLAGYLPPVEIVQ